MNKITTLVFCLFLSFGSVFSQKIDYDNNSNWFLGLNAGATWHTTDVSNKLYAGWGLTLGRSFNYNYGKKISFDLRARYLRGFWYGQDYDSTSLQTYTGTSLQTYKDSLGFSVNNFQTDVHRLGFELVLHANGISEKTGFDPYIFGGVGFTWHQTFGDLGSDTSTWYNYDPTMLGNNSYINNLKNNTYDSPLDGSNMDKFNVNFMPSIGFGLGYQVGKRVSIGIEHKTTFTLLDDFDGYVSQDSKYNDIYHYTSAYLQFRFRGHNQTAVTDIDNVNTGGGGVNNLDNSGNSGCVSPTIKFINPASNGLVSSVINYQVALEIKDILGRDNIVFKQNGVTNLNYTYNSGTDRLESNVVLLTGLNTFEITATNTCGSDVETITVNYQPCNVPEITKVNPTSNGTMVSNASYSLKAMIQNANNGQGITLTHNERSVTNYVFNTATGSFESTVTLSIGLNTFVLTSVNSCGTDVETITINYQNCIAPVISVLTPTSNGTTVNSASFNLSALILNSNNGQGITLKKNNTSITNFSFNNATNTFQSTVILTSGINTFVLTSVNSCGTDTETITVIFKEPIVEEKITICHRPPGNPTNTQVLEIPLSAWAAHQAHGDVLGPCPVVEDPIVEEKITICHRPPGNPTNTQVLEIPLSAWAAHQAHGDVLGPCPVVEDPIIEEKITICHRPPGNPTNTQVLEIPLSAWAAHQAHGDVLGPCPVVEDPIVEEKITICHRPPGNPTNTQVLEIPLSAWAAHQAHGDVLGPCPVVEDPIIEEKITICHRPPGNPTNTQVLEIPLSAWAAHQAHGDVLGPCPVVEDPIIEEKITICHRPPGNPTNTQILEIPLSAWAAHQAHGDVLGPCPVVEDPIVEEKITICHRPPGNPTNTQVLEIPLSAWAAHQAHGDVLGPCPVVEDPIVEEKITICHRPPGNPTNTQVLEIPLSAWAAHQAHGDVLGPCPVVEEPIVEEKITICHRPPGNPTNTQVLEIPLSAWAAHQAHGDVLGPCPVVEDPIVEEKIIICHRPPGNPTNTQVLEIPLSAWAAHQAHGDVLGPCPVVEDPIVEEKITICHRPPGNPTNTQVLEIPLSAWAAHQAHGDVLGPCPDNNNDGSTGNSEEEGNNSGQSGEEKPSKSESKPIEGTNEGQAKPVELEKKKEEIPPATPKIGKGKGKG